MDERHQQRIASNEARFRDMNDNLVRHLEAFDDPESYQVMCECALLNCEDTVEISREHYRTVRAQPCWFVVLPEHVLQAAEAPVSKDAGYWVIEKLDVAGKRAKDLYNPA